jgi:hypothetical protein
MESSRAKRTSAAGAPSSTLLDRLAFLHPALDPRRHDVHVEVAEVFRRDRGGVASVSELVEAVEDERGRLVGREIGRRDLVEIDPPCARKVGSLELLLRIAVIDRDFGARLADAVRDLVQRELPEVIRRMSGTLRRGRTRTAEQRDEEGRPDDAREAEEASTRHFPSKDSTPPPNYGPGDSPVEGNIMDVSCDRDPRCPREPSA